MKIGIIKEIKDKENRVSVTPDGVRELVNAGHVVLVEQGAGSGSGFTDREYLSAGAHITGTADAWSVELVVKVKEPLEEEYQYLNKQIVFTFFHLAGVTKKLTEVLLETGVAAIAYETLEDEYGKLPILAPMSAVAGNMAALMGNYYLAKFNGGKGMLLGTVLGKQYGKVAIIGDGVVGRHAAHVASSMGAEVLLFGRDEARGRQLIDTSLPKIQYVLSNRDNIQQQITDIDLLVGAVLLRGAKAPHVVSEDMVSRMGNGSVIVDVSIDQGGCIETSQPTSHSDPVFVKHGVIHYCVTNMPGAYPRTSTIALAESTLPYLLALADHGIKYFAADEGLKKAINVFNRHITCRAVAEVLGLDSAYKEIDRLN